MNTPNPHDSYQSPLAGRYASREMQEIWSARRKFTTWRRIWLAAAQAQHQLGLPVTQQQLEELAANLDVTDADLARAAEYEAELRHDVMAHVHAWGERCPKARGIIHLGMTSQDVNDNAELALLEAAGGLIARRLDAVVLALGDAAAKYKTVPTLGFTHYQPAQPTTVGRRMAGWAYDLVLCGRQLRHSYEGPNRRGLRGATGTQASYLRLTGNPEAVAKLENCFLDVLEGNSEPSTFLLTNQTYPRLHDCFITCDLACIAAALHKIATDIRLLANRKEMDEPFGAKQIGSSAMPHKRNPMMCERICGLSRFVWNLAPNTFATAAAQWLERTLDDSSNRRLTLPEAFLALDGALLLMERVARGMEVHEAMVRRNLREELPFLAAENLMMQAVQQGGDRQQVHEAIRRHAMQAAGRIKADGGENDLLDRLRAEPLLKGVNIDLQLDPMSYTGLAVQQTERFLSDIIEPLRQAFAGQAPVNQAYDPKV